RRRPGRGGTRDRGDALKPFLVPLAVAALALAQSAPARAPVQWPRNAHVVAPAGIRTLFSQCSRYSPDYRPTRYRLRTSDIVALEHALPEALLRFAGNGVYGRQVLFEPNRYLRQYA